MIMSDLLLTDWHQNAVRSDFVHLQCESSADALSHCALQSSWPAGQYAAAVVTVHLVFALLEKQRLENFEERGEV